MSRQLRVFLCHASQDKPPVRELYQRLKGEDWIDPWLDKVSILPGKNWRTVIEKAVEDSDVALICLSNQAVSKEGFVQREFKYAYDIALEKPEGTIYLIPLRLDDCDVPRGLRSFQYVNYFDDERENAYTDLLRSLRERYEQVLLHEEKRLEQERLEEETKREVEKAIRQRAIEQAITEQIEIETKKKVTAEIRKKKQKEFIGKLIPSIRRLGIVGIILVSLITIFLGGNYLINTLEPTATPQSLITPTLTTELAIGPTIVSEKDNMALVFVPAGEFVMGSSDRQDEKPIREVYLRSYWIDQTEVTNSQYKLCVDENRCDPPNKIRSATREDYYGNTEFDNFPVIFVSWYDAKTYCEWANKRLPTEAEWEKASRGTNGWQYTWGNDEPNDNLLNFNSNVGDTTEVRKYQDVASVYDAYDMNGNVWEWVNDWYGTYQNSSNENPLGPISGNFKVRRGGSWFDDINRVKSSSRGNFEPDVSNEFLGFRCAMDAE